MDLIDSLQVNNLYSFGHTNKDMLNKDLYLKIINERLDLMRSGGISLHLQDARDYHALARILEVSIQIS